MLQNTTKLGLTYATLAQRRVGETRQRHAAPKSSRNPIQRWSHLNGRSSIPIRISQINDTPTFKTQSSLIPCPGMIGLIGMNLGPQRRVGGRLKMICPWSQYFGRDGQSWIPSIVGFTLPHHPQSYGMTWRQWSQQCVPLGGQAVGNKGNLLDTRSWLADRRKEPSFGVGRDFT